MTVRVRGTRYHFPMPLQDAKVEVWVTEESGLLCWTCGGLFSSEGERAAHLGQVDHVHRDNHVRWSARAAAMVSR